MIPEFTASVGAPRVAGIEFPFGRPLGLPGDRAGQRAVLTAALEVASLARAPGTVIRLPFAWPPPSVSASRHGAETRPITSSTTGRRRAGPS
jgi:hypothetical protein